MEMTVPSPCQTGKNVICLSFAWLQHETVSLCAVLGKAASCPCCARRARASRRALPRLPRGATRGSPPAMQHGPGIRQESRGPVCLFAHRGSPGSCTCCKTLAAVSSPCACSPWHRSAALRAPAADQGSHCAGGSDLIVRLRS